MPRRPGAELRGGVVSSEEHCKLSPVLMATYMLVLFVGLARIPSVILPGTKLHPPSRPNRRSLRTPSYIRVASALDIRALGIIVVGYRVLLRCTTSARATSNFSNFRIA